MLLRVLLDTSVVRAGFVSKAGASRRSLEAVLGDHDNIAAVASTALMLEYEAVLLRPETLRWAGVSAHDAHGFLDALCTVCRPVAIRVRWRPQLPDSGEDLVVDAAVNGLADIITTFNLRDLRSPAARFGITAEAPVDTLRRIA